jgi:hypothetical protein
LLFWVLAIPQILPICHPWRESIITVPTSFPLSEHINNFIVRWPCTGQTSISRQFAEKNVIALNELTNVTRGFITSSISYTTLHLLASDALDAVTLLEKNRPKIAPSYPKSLLDLEEKLNQVPDFVHDYLHTRQYCFNNLIDSLSFHQTNIRERNKFLSGLMFGSACNQFSHYYHHNSSTSLINGTLSVAKHNATILYRKLGDGKKLLEKISEYAFVTRYLQTHENDGRNDFITRVTRASSSSERKAFNSAVKAWKFLNLEVEIVDILQQVRAARKSLKTVTSSKKYDGGTLKLVPLISPRALRKETLSDEFGMQREALLSLKQEIRGDVRDIEGVFEKNNLLIKRSEWIYREL